MDETVLLLSHFGNASPVRKVLFPDEVEHLEQAKEIVLSASDMACRMLLCVLLSIRLSQETAHQEGLESGRAEAAALLKKIRNNNIRHLEETKAGIAGIIAEAVHHLIGIYPPGEQMAGHISRLLAPLQDQERLLITVSPENEQGLRERINLLVDSYPHVKRFDIASDPALSDVECIVESPVGRVTSSLQAQTSLILELLTDGQERAPKRIADDA
ncbi:MAG: hypothetical protein PW790_11155 [Parvibaculaceae bacterium]|nr:hypothetical protein [Parvibaculaceae bacterium]